MRRFLLSALLALGAASVLVVAPATPAANSPAANSSTDIAETQEAHFAVIDAIGNWDALAPVSQIGSISGDPVAGTISIGWVGFVPSEIQQIADEAATRGIDVTFVPQESSEAELLELAQGLAASMPVEGAFAIGIGADTLSVEVPTAEAAEAADTEPIPLEGEVLEVIDETEQAAAEIGATVTVEETDSVPTTTAAVATDFAQGAQPNTGLSTARTNDTSVLSGGARVQTQFLNGAWTSCTSGFSGFYGHRPVIVTAAHCSDYADDRGVRNNAGVRIGTSDLVAELNDGPTSYDLGVIAAPYDTRTLPRIYTGDTSTINITGTQTTWPPAGYRLCSSGQVTGWKCDLIAAESYVTCYSTPRGNSECMNVQLVNSTGTRAFCLGDSGGPVVGLPTAEGARAVGVVSGLRSPLVGSCSTRGLIAPMSQLMSTVPGLQLHTVQTAP
ncbi:trypsin-like serine protease [Agrococcus beijingensis]|uniref:trypsin-like serine protease n=1 Tax=Agrococcus beijingensis TaxID=3068634 RepID=UPI002740859D|nr:trypsin-like serine protease [Agrococcus sp. REN33]